MKASSIAEATGEGNIGCQSANEHILAIGLIMCDFGSIKVAPAPEMPPVNQRVQ